MKIAVAGARGFVGRAVVAHLQLLGCEVVHLDSPRLKTLARALPDLQSEAESIVGARTPCRTLNGASALINAAGMARPESALDDALVGANALLPAVHALEARRAGVARLVHVSSAAVYGSTTRIDETRPPTPTSPYGTSKLLGDALLKIVYPEAVIYRPTSVHGHDRRITQVLTRFARSPMSSVAGAGVVPTPQIRVENVGAAATFLALHGGPPPHAVVHPWEGVTTASILRILSGGREPIHIPVTAARGLLWFFHLIGQAHPRLGANARRLEMLWFGQEQVPGWLSDNGYTPAYAWPDLKANNSVDARTME